MVHITMTVYYCYNDNHNNTDEAVLRSTRGIINGECVLYVLLYVYVKTLFTLYIESL